MRNLVPLTLWRVIAVLCVIGLAACGKTYVEDEVPNTFELSEDTPISVEIVDPANVAALAPGDPFDAVLSKPLYYEREKLDPQGDVFETTTLIAPAGAPVAGVAVASSGGDEGDVGLQLTSITVHGGMSFPVETTIVEAPHGEPADELSFRLTAPADVAMVLDFRDKEEAGTSAN